MQDFLQLINNKKLENFKSNIKSKKNQMVFGLNSELKGLFLAVCDARGVYVAKDLIAGTKIAQMLSAFDKKSRFITSPYQNSLNLVDNNLKHEFVASVNQFLDGKIDFLIVSPDALFQKIPSKNAIISNAQNISKGANVNLQTLIQNLVRIGYTRTEFVASRGQFTVKGDTLQIFPVDTENMFKIEFFDTEVEKIAEVSFSTKKFIQNVENIKLIDINFDAQNLQNNISKNIQKTSDNTIIDKKIQNIHSGKTAKKSKKDFCNLLDLSENVFFDEPKQIFDLAENYAKVNEIPNFEGVFDCDGGITAFANVVAKTFFEAEDFCNFSIMQAKNYVFDFKSLLQDVKFFADTGKDVYLFCRNEKNKQILDDFLQKNLLAYGKKDKIKTTVDFLPFSANLIDADCVLIGTYDLFRKEKTTLKTSKKTFFTPKINDYVVHETHGVGKCVGLEKMSLNGAVKDYFILEYAGGDRFYVPSEQADMLSAYHSDGVVKLNKLGGVEFSRTKEKVYKNVKALAFDLIKLYAQRESSKGFVYNKDDYLMEQFENAFPFEETPDQLRAISEIKADMESPRIMDRLVCGDVGFGKTEVALRAIYKAILSGKQVAFLCPTTILAEQHYKTAINRFNGFMVKIARFNRLMPKTQEKEVLAGLENGSVNLVCGTHKLLSKNVKFKNLGLLVLDEEQRFGVEHKEQIKNLKHDIDVLSLSATPIPRTLHMSLSGIRDISIIDTPPKERQPVQTFVTPFSEEIVVRASKQELARNGQILIIYNRIDTIYDFANYIKSLLPNTKIGITHGRLSQKMLEDSILKLYAHEFDILISTTLIENGIDLPTANTLIVVDADKLGLSQLYQIRGRIGRSNRTAFAYLTFAEDKKLTDDAYNRLSALMENTSLGSGYKIALADLDIRGAGNVLGKEQHGNMLKVGYDLYYKLLKTAVKEIKGQKTTEVREVKLDIALDAYIPENYVQNEDERIKLISEISELESFNSTKEFKSNLLALYGKIPKEVENLVTFGYLKNLAQNKGVKRILINQTKAEIYFYEKEAIILTEFTSPKDAVSKTVELLK